MGATPGSITAAPGGAALIQVSVSGIDGFTGSVSVTVSGAPSGVTFTPSLPLTMSPGQQTIALFIPPAASTGQFSMMVNASAGSLQHSAPVMLSIQQSSFADFSVNVNNSELSLAQGGSASTIAGLSIASQSGSSNFAVEFSVSGLPNGVQAVFAMNPLVAGQPATALTIEASASATLANNLTVTLVGTRTADGAQETAPFVLNVTPPAGTLPAIRTDFIRMDGTPAAAVYDAAHQVIYASDPEWNRVDVISPVTRQLVTSIPTPSPSGIDLSPDGKELRVGSSVQQIATIDTTSLQVTNRTNVTPFVQGGETYSIPAILASTLNGTVLVGMTLDSSPPAYFLEQWKPSAGTFTPRSAPGVTFYINRLVRSSDGSKVLVVDYGTDLNLAVYDSATDTFPISGQSPVGQVLYAAANPAQLEFAILGTNGLSVLDAQLNTLATTTAGFSPNANAIYGIVFSADGTKLYMVNLYSEGLPLIEVYDAQTLAFLGEAPAFQTEIPFFLTEPIPNILATPVAVDATGRIFGLISHGIVFDDATNLQNLLSAPAVPPIGQLGPNEAPLDAPFPTTLGQESFDVIPDVWFDNIRGTNIQLSGPLVNVTAPASPSVGIVNVKAVLPDGWFSFDPQAFSYGTEVFYLGGTASGLQGGATLDLIGHGLQAIQTVTIGGQSASVEGVAPYSAETPFLLAGLDHLRVTVPSGISGPADVTVTGPSGSSTLPKGFQYLPGVTDYSSNDTFAFALYDSTRHHVYLSAGDHVDVFAADTQQFLTPIVPPTISGTRQLSGLALTPDDSKLIIANSSDLSVVIVDPDNPSSNSVVKVPVTIANSPGLGSVAATSTGKVFVAGVSETFGGCSGQLWEIDLGTLSVAQRTDSAVSCIVGTAQFTSDSAGDKVLIGPALWNASTDQFISTNLVNDDGTASGDGVWFASDYSLLDSEMLQHNSVQVPEFFADDFTISPNGAVVGEKMNASGSLLYIPLRDGVDMVDTNHGSWAGRILLTEQMPVVQNAMALDEAGSRLFLITNAGLTVVQLGAAPLSIGYLNPGTGPAAGGTTVTLRGSGFETGTTVTVGGTSVTSSFVDGSTLTFVTPSGNTGGARVTLQNPDGTTYSLDAAFTYD
ncbi:MAG: IPT/TIG domain-containing protein [Candidatus Acidiferrales bacterium]